MTSDYPCVKPDISVLPYVPPLADYTIPPAPPPFADCKDLELPTPEVFDSSLNRSFRVYPVILTTNMEDCSATVRRIRNTGSGPTAFGDPFEASVVDESCACDGVLEGTITWVTTNADGDAEFVNLQAPSMLAFELTEDLVDDTLPYTGTAEVLKQDGTELVGTGIEIEIADYLGKFKCAKEGDRGYVGCSQVINDVADKVWEITEMHTRAKQIEFTLNTDVAATDPNVEVTVTSWLFGSEGPDDIVTVLNTMGFIGVSGAFGEAYMNADCNYQLRQLACDESA